MAAINVVREFYDRFVARMEDHTGRELTRVRAAAIAVAAGLTVVSAVALVAWLLHQLQRLLGWLGDGAGHLNDALSSPHAAQLVRVATDPLVAWTEQHTAGLAVSASTLLTVWAIGGAVLFLGGLGGARGARVAWPLFGAATAAMAWHGAAEPHRPVAAGLIVLAWGVLSILVLHRGGSQRCTHLTVQPGEPNPAPAVPAPSSEPQPGRHTEAFTPALQGGGADGQR